MTYSKNNLIERPPVVVIMGHIDHGKSTLLDHIRKSNIVENEAGQITQHLGAYEVKHKDASGNLKKITFIDTPGHEAFKSVRCCGSNVADIGILIVSAEDGVMPQTLEALENLKNDNIPFIVAISKIDSPKANVELTKSSLIENEIYIEGFGGKIPAVEISAKTGQNVSDLLDLILLSAEIEELKADPDVLAEGVIIEVNKDEKKGISATTIIKNGTLKQKQFIVCEDAYSPIRIMEDQNKKQIEVASFSTPVYIRGWNKLPKVGYDFRTFESKKEAEKYSTEHVIKKENSKKETCVQNSNFIVPLIIKADTQGSLDAIKYELKKIDLLNTEIKIIESDTGDIGEADIKKASSNKNSIIVGFGVGIHKQAVIMKDRLDVLIKTFNIIYELTQWLEETIEEFRPKVEIEERKGLAKVLRVFNKTKNHQVIGGKVKEGVIRTGNRIRILRREKEIGQGIIQGLQQQKSVSEEIAEGVEFGSSIDAKIEILAGDELETFEIVKK